MVIIWCSIPYMRAFAAALMRLKNTVPEPKPIFRTTGPSGCWSLPKNNMNLLIFFSEIIQSSQKMNRFPSSFHFSEFYIFSNKKTLIFQSKTSVLPEALLYHSRNLQGTTTYPLFTFSFSSLYHSRNLQGTTTTRWRLRLDCQLYHSRNLQGTTTYPEHKITRARLYHSRNLQGTTTCNTRLRRLRRLYHSRNLQGTTTYRRSHSCSSELYHSRNLQGTTTKMELDQLRCLLYHSRNLQGTTTLHRS